MAGLARVAARTGPDPPVTAFLGADPGATKQSSTMRMMVGLATPDGDAVRIAESPVSLGAPVLRRAES